MKPSVLDRFFSKVEMIPFHPCWEWTGAKNNTGYGQFRPVSRSLGGNMVAAHVFCYESLVGPVPEHLDLDHLCRNRGCVNPDHLEPVTRSVNMLRSPIVGRGRLKRTHCPKGHQYDGENLIRTGISRYRRCRICKNEANSRYGKRAYAESKLTRSVSV